METGAYRVVPYRFFVNESDVAMCKLKQLANLFPDMKSIIELELFKSNNLSRIIERLSSIYSQVSALDVRDDTFHLFLGPYHLSLGPAVYAALRFQNVSTALLAAASTQGPQGEAMSKQKRRRETVLRRFRRTVRKIILIRSILDQIRLGSVLTPYNQHELTSNGIYDLVLAGHQSNGQCKLDEATVAEEFDRLQTLNYPEQKSFLLASNFIKVSTLLYLMTPFRAAESGAPSIPVNEPTSNPNDPKGILDTSPLCCSQHGQRTSLVMLPIKPPAPPPPPPSQLMSSGSRSRLSSTQSHRPVLSRQNTASSHYDSTASDGYSPMVSASTSALAVNSNGVDVSPISNISSSRAPPEEDALINQISSLLTNYLLSHPSTKIKEKFTDIIDHETLNPNRIDYSISSAPSNNHQDPSGSFNLSLFSSSPPSSSLATSNEFDRLLHRIKTTASNTLSRKASNLHHIHESASPHRKPSLTRGLRRQLFSVRTSSYHETSLTDYDPQHLPVLHTKHRFDSFSKSQSLDETDSEYLPSAGSDLGRFDRSTERLP